MALKLIANPTATDMSIIDILVPSTKGVPCGPGCAPIPADWHARILAGQYVPSCSFDAYRLADADNSLQVGDLAQSRMSNPAYNAGIPAQDLADLQARLNPFRVCFMGDSITQGLCSTGNTCDGFRPGAAAIADPRGRCVYVGMQSRAVSQPPSANINSVRPTWYHSGISGSFTDDHVHSLFIYGSGPLNPVYGTGGFQVNPHVFVILIGTNDAARQDSAATFTSNYNALLDGLHANCPAAVFVGCLQTHNSSAAAEAALVQYRAALPGIWDSAVSRGINIAARVDLSVLSGSDFDVDGVHLSASGYTHAATLVGAGLATALAAIGGP